MPRRGFVRQSHSATGCCWLRAPGFFRTPEFQGRFVLSQRLHAVRKFGRTFLDLTRHGIERLSQVGDLQDSRFSRLMGIIPDGQLAGQVLQSDDRNHDPPGHEECRKQDQACGNSGDAERRVSHLYQRSEGLGRVDLDHHAPLNSRQISPYGPHVMSQVIGGGTFSVAPLQGDRHRLVSVFRQAVSLRFCFLGTGRPADRIIISSPIFRPTTISPVRPRSLWSAAMAATASKSNRAARIPTLVPSLSSGTAMKATSFLLGG